MTTEGNRSVIPVTLMLPPELDEVMRRVRALGPEAEILPVYRQAYLSTLLAAVFDALDAHERGGRDLMHLNTTGDGWRR